MLEIAASRLQGAFKVDVDLVAGSGVTALFGRSGSGKTSVINMVAGLARPDSGRIVADGRVLFDSRAGIDLAPERRRLGYVFQEPRLFPHLSVRANLEFGMRLLAPAERSVRWDDVVGVLGIGHLLDRRPARLSGGEKQRVAIGRALLASPQVLLMDEPLAALDTQRKAELLPFIAQLSRRFQVPILYVSHAMDEVLRLADTLVLMDGGRAAAVGPVEDLLSNPDLRPLTGRYDAGAVITATVAGHDSAYGISRLAFSGGTLVVARCDQAVGTTVRVRVHARDIAIAVEAPARVSVRNVLPAVVRSAGLAEGHLVDVMLDCGGTSLWAQITAHAQAQLQLVKGMRVHALIKAVTISRGDVAGRPESSPGK
ncbi:molybdenum ABC transporter ATP-binding protein [Magnetospirillum sp. UT-4]|uniref:molybdenum ABC transporter ATP-binding protein n=1 Tax=Magnetospirillum sp. UT-4 TaxID=2681467 RepID=UPI001380944D|nr:molybdenum ABC transporter ATP-binding protein [Magnetospirillum sp. UT-4]CAA7615256.1 molybdate transporter subunit; ATP-binding component of ABC superfamily [Magnetospirillum sp. UT-4]